MDGRRTVTLDKLPGAFWLQALSMQGFGVHTWAIVLPQVVEGVLVLYRIVRRLAGPGAGVVAVAVLAVSPAVVALDRGNISDSLMILLVLLSVFSYPNGDEVLPIGGFTGTGPSPSLDQVRATIARGQFHLVLTFPSGDPRIAWIAQHCRPLPDTPPPFHGFSCTPADAAPRVSGWRARPR